MNVVKEIQQAIANTISDVFEHEVKSSDLVLTPTKKEFEGDFTLVTFPFTKLLRKKPEEIGEQIGASIKQSSPLIEDFNVIKGFLNLSLAGNYWNSILQNYATAQNPFAFEATGKKVLVEFSSPNTNKPLHLGHIRNILLGWSTAKLKAFTGNDVVKLQVINDRGIAICKSMIAWSKTANGATPHSEAKKGDHFVGDYYVAFERMFQTEYKAWQETDAAKQVFSQSEEEDETKFFKSFKNKYFNTYSQIGKESKDLLLKWEEGDEAVRTLWSTMNGWVYEGFEETYQKMGVDFDNIYYESNTYLLGKQSIQKGLEDGVFYQKDDGSVWIDLEDEGLDHKLVLRSDGTSVYMTQDIGTAQQRNEDHSLDSMVYVVADEQDYHFKALFKILKKLGEPYADELVHLSYGMVDLPTGKMKSREGTIVDADDLMNEVINEAKLAALERGEIEGKTDQEKAELYKKIGLAALKFFIIKVNPKKRMTFDPKESVDMQGQTGPYIQNAYVRIQSVLRRVADDYEANFDNYENLEAAEKDLMRQIVLFKEVIAEASDNYDPSHLANYCYNLAKLYHKFYHDCSILKAERPEMKSFRIALSGLVGSVLKIGMELLGIELPEYM